MRNWKTKGRPQVTDLLDFSRRLDYLNNEDYRRISTLREEVGKLLWNFYKKVSG